ILEFPASVYDNNVLRYITGFLGRCLDIERLVVPKALLCPDTHSKLVELLARWDHLKELTIVEFYLTDRMLAEIIRTACQARRRRRHLDNWSPSHHAASLETALSDLGHTNTTTATITTTTTTTTTTTAAVGDSIMTPQGGQGLESLHLRQGFVSYPHSSLAIIKFHGATLVCVTLVNSKVVDRADLHQLLCSCPNLEVLEAMATLAKDSFTWSKSGDPVLAMEDMNMSCFPSPGHDSENEETIESSKRWWICSRLRVLKLRYLPRELLTMWETGIPYELAMQLSRMRHLEDLRLGRVTAARLGIILTDPEYGFGVLSPSSASSAPSSAPSSSSSLAAVAVTVTCETDSTSILRLLSKSDSSYESAASIKKRTESVTLTLQTMARELKNLKRLELRGLKAYVDHDELRKARKAWKQIEWIQYN
ncbi:hypothetical protein BGZ65_008897, partial [Modicella reniformis]